MFKGKPNIIGGMRILDWDMICDDYDSGLTIAELTRRFKCSRGAVQRILRLGKKNEWHNEETRAARLRMSQIRSTGRRKTLE